MGDYVEGKNNIKGSLFVEFYFGLEAYDGVKEIPLEFNVDGQIVNKEVNVSNTTETEATTQYGKSIEMGFL